MFIESWPLIISAWFKDIYLVTFLFSWSKSGCFQNSKFLCHFQLLVPPLCIKVWKYKLDIHIAHEIIFPSIYHTYMCMRLFYEKTEF